MTEVIMSVMYTIVFLVTAMFSTAVHKTAVYMTAVCTWLQGISTVCMTALDVSAVAALYKKEYSRLQYSR